METIHGACPHDCPDTCAWLVTVDDDGRVVKFEGDPDHPFTQGALCSKLKRYPDRVYSEDRILYPLRRIGAKGEGNFERVSWDEALDECVGRLKETVAKHGPLAAMPYNFAGTIGMLQRYAGEQFFQRLGATEILPDICGATALDAVTSVIGAVDPMLPEDVEHSRFIVIWGTNTVATNLHLWSTVIRKARSAGAQVVVVDPIKTPTAERADWHVQLKPGSDAALALAMMHVIVRDELHDMEFIEKYTLGFDKLCERIKEYPPERAAEITGIAAADIEKLAQAYATTRPSVIRSLVGMERYSNGDMSHRAVACLPALIGGYRERGGGLCTFTIFNSMQALDHSAIMADAELPPRERSVSLSQLGIALTDPAMDPPIEWMMVYNSNPVVTAANQNLTIQGLMRDDLFTVVHEQFMTDTALYADILLPATTQFEHLELMPSWGTNYVALNPQAIEPLGEAIANTELFRRLSKAMGFTEEFLHITDEERIRRILDSGSPYIEGITYERLQRDGWAPLNMGDYAPLAEGRFGTPSGKCEFYSEAMLEAGRDPLPKYEPLADRDYGNGEPAPLHLVTAKTSHFLNSEYVNLRHKGTAKHEPEVEINPADAETRDIADGDIVRMFNCYGEVQVRASVSDVTSPGVVYMPFNWWPASTPNGAASANALTPDGLSGRGIGSDAFDAHVEIRKTA